MKSIAQLGKKSADWQHAVSADIVILGSGYGDLHVAQRLMRLCIKILMYQANYYSDDYLVISIDSHRYNSFAKVVISSL